ncbi:EpsG family protein [Vibrio sp. 10N.222.49.C12]|uniref:EpsG family protein n=1 Tax=Vibrio sp. 10N.222.49.C12 TaxID=3229614 RepID=UPI00354FF785
MAIIDVTYTLFVFLCLFLCLLIGSFRNYREARFNSIYIIITIILLAFSSMRELSVGTDTRNYAHLFYLDTTYLQILITKGVEFIYFFMTNLIKSFGGSFYTVMLITSFFIVFCYLIQIKKYSENIALSLMVFICLFYTFHFNALRQSIAMAIVFFAFPYILKERMFHSIFLVFIAAMFHKTAFIMLPVIYLLHYKGRYRNVIVVIFSFVLAILSSHLIEFASSIDSRYEHYNNMNSGGGKGTTSFFVLLFIIFYAYKKQAYTHCNYYGKLLTLYLIGILISLTSILLSLDPSGPLRLNQYLLQSSIFMVPMLVNSIPNRVERNVVAITFVFLCCVFFILFTSNLANLSPFYFRELF